MGQRNIPHREPQCAWRHIRGNSTQEPQFAWLHISEKSAVSGDSLTIMARAGTTLAAFSVWRPFQGNFENLPLEHFWGGVWHHVFFSWMCCWKHLSKAPFSFHPQQNTVEPRYNESQGKRNFIRYIGVSLYRCSVLSAPTNPKRSLYMCYEIICNIKQQRNEHWALMRRLLLSKKSVTSVCFFMAVEIRKQHFSSSGISCWASLPWNMKYICKRSIHFYASLWSGILTGSSS